MHPIKNEVGGIFIPVSDIEKARDWYNGLLGLEGQGEIVFGHLYILPMKGLGIVLDSKIYAPEHVYKTPAFHINTDDIAEAYHYVKAKNVAFITEIQYNQWFNFTDPDGNMLMVCQC